ncbi:copper chaperone [Maridesulfovibrio ferrireducens]|uniref:Copper chaperone n=1 Tax=Maridesulfovibrio ferrireducens TaxID=246191 RepID=A0A1G9ECU1_9BACT|nr:heavy metal-associated domain-containing protein [Maridesulfovibrio ferrireducens]SDK73979.1 copper chaperone [Maridesulfovibrio ferrireducens]
MKTVEIKGMSCPHCVASVTKALSSVEGLKNISVSLEKAEASYEEVTPVDEAKIKEVISKIGFEPGAVK